MFLGNHHFERYHIKIITIIIIIIDMNCITKIIPETTKKLFLVIIQNFFVFVFPNSFHYLLAKKFGFVWVASFRNIPTTTSIMLNDDEEKCFPMQIKLMTTTTTKMTMIIKQQQQRQTLMKSFDQLI